MSTASNWLWNFGIGYATPYMVDDGPGRAGMGSAVFCEPWSLILSVASRG